MKNYICNGNKYAYSKGYIYMPIHMTQLPKGINVQGQELSLKSTFHVCLVCVKNILAVHGEDIPDLEQKILDCFCDFIAVEDISEFNYGDEFKFVQHEDRKSVIVMCDISNIKKFSDFVKSKLNIEIEAQPTHVTLYTLQPDAGIGLNSKGDIENKSISIQVPEEIKRVLGVI